MNRSRQLAHGAVIATPEDPCAPEQDANPIVLIDELAQLLKTSVRTLKRQIRAGSLFIPELPKIDRRHRWSRVVVLRCIADAHESIHTGQRTKALAVVPRKAQGESVRERGGR